MRTEIVSRNMDDLIELNSLARALDAITELMEQPFDSYMDKPTPCPGWDVRALIDHIVDLTVRIGAAAGIVVSDQPDATPQQRIAATVRPIIEGWQRRGMSGTIIFRDRPLADRTAINTLALDLILHGWDLATALGRDLSIADPHADYWLHFARTALTETVRATSGFGPPAPGYEFGVRMLDRLVAFTGRDPQAWYAVERPDTAYKP